MEQEKHTPTPWLQDEDEGLTIYGAQLDDGRHPIVAEVWAQEAENYPADCTKANALLIVAAVNSHAALVDALRDCLANLQMECPECEGCKTDLCVQCRAKAALKLAQADEFKPERKGRLYEANDET